jgi:hypothetical protein
MVITALYTKRNRLYLHTLVFVLLVSWISLAISATCTMPMPSAVAEIPEHMPGCPSEHSDDQGYPTKSMQDCSFKPCLDSQNDSPTDFNRLVKPDLPVFILYLIGTFFCLFLSYPPTKAPLRKADPPLGRRILLIYRFCTLLN